MYPADANKGKQLLASVTSTALGRRPLTLRRRRWGDRRCGLNFDDARHHYSKLLATIRLRTIIVCKCDDLALRFSLSVKGEE